MSPTSMVFTRSKRILYSFCSKSIFKRLSGLSILPSLYVGKRNFGSFVNYPPAISDKHPVSHSFQGVNHESSIFIELKEIILLLHTKSNSSDEVSKDYFFLRKKVLQISSDFGDDVDELFNIFEEDLNLYLINNSSYVLDSSTNHFTKLQLPNIIQDNIEYDSESKIKEYAVKLEVFHSISGLILLWHRLNESKDTKPLLGFVANMILIRAVKELKPEEIQFLLLYDAAPSSKTLPITYENSINFYSIQQWICRSNILQEIGLQGLCFAFFDALFIRLFSIGEKNEIFSYFSYFKQSLLHYGSFGNDGAIRRLFRILLYFAMNQNIQNSTAIHSDTSFYLSIANAPYNNLVLSARYKYNDIFTNFFQSVAHSPSNFNDGKTICSFIKWTIQHLHSDLRTLSTSLEQIYLYHSELVKKSYKNKEHLMELSNISFLAFLAKYFVAQKRFSESFHVLSIMLLKARGIFEQHLSKQSQSFSKSYLDIFCRFLLMLSNIYEAILREGMLRLPQYTNINNSSNKGYTPLTIKANSQIFSFEKIDPNATMKISAFVSLLFTSLKDTSYLLFKMSDLHPDSYHLASELDVLLSAKIRLAISVLPPLVNFSYISAFSFLAELKDDEHSIQKFQSSNAYSPGVHALNFVLGIASLSKSVCSSNLKDLVFDYFFKGLEVLSSPSSVQLPKPYAYRFFECIDSLITNSPSFPQKIISAIFRLGIKPNLLSICFFCRGSFAFSLIQWMNDSNLELSTSYITSFICKLIESPTMLGDHIPNYPLSNLSLPIEYDSLELPFLSLCTQFLTYFKNSASYPKALKVYSAIIQRRLKTGVSLDDHYEFRCNFLQSFLFLSTWDIFPSNTPVTILIQLIWTRICLYLSSSKFHTFPLCPELFYDKSINSDLDSCALLIEKVSESVSGFVKSVTLSDINAWISLLELKGYKTIGSLRQLQKSSFHFIFPEIPHDACYLILNYCVKPSFVVEMIPFVSTNQIYAHHSPVLNSKSGRFILSCQN